MFGSKKDKEPKEKPGYEARVGMDSHSRYYDVYQYRLLDDGTVKLRTTQGIITLMPGTPCQISGGEWE